jgi:hypothetical protein
MTFSIAWAGQGKNWDRDKALIRGTMAEDEELVNDILGVVDSQLARLSDEERELEVDVHLSGYSNPRSTMYTLAVRVASNSIANQQMRGDRERRSSGAEIMGGP